MKYWSMTAISRYPELHHEVVAEMENINRTSKLSPRGIAACGFIIQHLKPQDAPNLAVVNSEGAPSRRLYLGYPGFDEWFSLERGGVMQDDFGVFFMIDALH